MFRNPLEERGGGGVAKGDNQNWLPNPCLREGP